jgi:catalase (peroxidase I)
MIYAMLKSRIADEQVANLYGTSWYTEQIAKLDKQFGGARPADTVVTGSAGEKIASIRLALQDPALKQSPVYKQISEFYPRYQELQDLLNKNNVSNYAQLTSKGGQPTLMRNELLALAQKLMIENPAFSRMYYGVFAGILEDK